MVPPVHGSERRVLLFLLSTLVLRIWAGKPICEENRDWHSRRVNFTAQRGEGVAATVLAAGPGFYFGTNGND
jgi:hypothetical protein